MEPRISTFPPLWGITDRHLVGEGSSLVDVVTEACKAGLPAVMLREKDLSDGEFSGLACLFSDLTSDVETKFLINVGRGEKINQRLRLAKEISSWGVHFPEGSWPGREARKFLHPDQVVGASVHVNTPEEDIYKLVEEVDYLLVAPLFSPFDKKKAPTWGEKGLLELSLKVKTPLLALGGIQPAHVSRVFHAGASGVAVRAGLWKTEETAAVVKQYLSEINE